MERAKKLRRFNMYNSEEEKEIKEIFYWENKMKVIHEEMTIFNSKIKNKNSKKIKRQSSYNIFEFAPKEVLMNEDFMIKALNETFIYFFMLPKELQENKDFNIRYLKEVNYSYYYNIDYKMLENEDVMVAAIQKNAEALTKINTHYNLRKIYLNEEKLLKLLEVNPKITQFFDKEWKNNEVIARKAIELDLENVKFINKKTCRKIFIDKDKVEKLLNTKQSDFEMVNFERINSKFFKDKEFLLKYLPKSPQIIKFVPDKMKSDMDILKLAAPAWNFLDEIDDKYKKDKDLMKIHLGHNPFNYEKVGEHIDIKSIMVSLIKKQHYPYTYLKEEDKRDEDYIYAVLDHDYFYEKPDSSIRYSTYSYNYQRSYIVKILPKDIQDEIIKEANEKYPEINVFNASRPKSTDEVEALILKYARDKYLNIYLKKHLNNKTSEKNKVKL